MWRWLSNLPSCATSVLVVVTTVALLLAWGAVCGMFRVRSEGSGNGAPEDARALGSRLGSVELTVVFFGLVVLSLTAAVVARFVQSPLSASGCGDYAVTLFTLVALLMALVGLGNVLWLRREFERLQTKNQQWQEKREREMNEQLGGEIEEMKDQLRREIEEMKEQLRREMTALEEDFRIALRSERARPAEPEGSR